MMIGPEGAAGAPLPPPSPDVGVGRAVAVASGVGDAVGVLEGWGGYYMLEAIPVGICGIMPGVPIADLLDRVYWSRREGRDDQAYDLLGSLLPFINFTLQDIELFLQVEKRLMVRRGIFKNPKGIDFVPTACQAVKQWRSGRT